MIKFTSWNLENFFITPHLKYPHRILKDKNKIKKVAEVIKDINPHFLFLTEVGGLEDLRLFNQQYLNQSFDIFFKKGNSNRGIELALMVNSNFLEERNWEVILTSHAKKPISFLYPHEVKENRMAITKGHAPQHKGHKMSRDLLQIEIYHRDDRKIPLFILLGVHFKSKLDKEGIDWNGERRRYAECRYCAEIYKKLQEKYHHKVPIFITGDFNGEAHNDKKDPEFRDLYQLDLEDFGHAFDLPQNHRYTFIGLDKSRKTVGLQLDYFFMPKALHRFLIEEESGFYRYKNEQGDLYPMPQNPGAKHTLPSDHYPIVISFQDEAFTQR